MPCKRNVEKYGGVRPYALAFTKKNYYYQEWNAPVISLNCTGNKGYIEALGFKEK